MDIYKNLKDALIIKIDYSSLDIINELINMLKSKDLELKKLAKISTL